MKIFTKVKNSVFFLYSTLCLLPIVAMVFIFCNLIDAATMKAEQKFGDALQNAKDYVDSELTNMDRVFSQVTLIPNIECLYSIGATMNDKQLFFIRSILPTLRTFEATNNRIEKIYMYFPSKDFLISGSGTYDRKTIDFWFRCVSGLDKNKIIQLANQKIIASFEPINFSDLKTNTGLPDRQALIAYVHSAVPTKDQQPPMIVLIFIKQSEIMNAFNNVSPTTYGSISTISFNNKYLFNTPPSFLADKPVSFFPIETDKCLSFTINSQGNNYRIMNARSDIANWLYILSMPENVYLADISELKYMMLLILLIYLITVTLAGWYFYRCNYKPLLRITVLINKFWKNNQQAKNDFTQIEQSVRTIIDDNKAINYTLEIQKDDALHGVLDKLIKPDQNKEVNLKNIARIGLYFDKPYFFVFILYSSLQYSDNAAIVYGDCNNILHEKLKSFFKSIEHIYIQRSEGFFVCIVNTDMDRATIATMSKQFCNDIEDLAFSNDSNHYMLAFSSIYYNIAELPNAYHEALEVKEYKTYWGINDLIFYEDMCSNIDASYIYTGDIGTELQIINHIKMHEYELAIEKINQQMNSILLMTSIPLILIKCRLFGVINLLLSIISELRSMYDPKFMEEINTAETLLQCQSFHDLHVCMNKIFNQMNNYIQLKREDLDNSRIHAIMEYVKCNYNNKDMSITYLCQIFNRNESYISRSFRRHVGMGFLDYLHSLRISEAKRLIIDGYSIKDITNKVGYTNETTLIRAFKRYEGITPGKLKAMDLGKVGEVNHELERDF